MLLVSKITAPLEAAYTARFLAALIPSTEATLIIEPPPSFRMYGNTERDNSQSPRTFTLKVASNCSSVICSAVPMCRMPALFTSTLRVPNCAMVAARTRPMLSCLETSPLWTRAAPPTSFATASKTCLRRPTRVRLAPSRAKAKAMARPIPVPAPVMSATLLARSDTRLMYQGRREEQARSQATHLPSRELEAFTGMIGRDNAKTKVRPGALGLEPYLSPEHPIYENEVSYRENHSQRPPHQPHSQSMMTGSRVVDRQVVRRIGAGGQNHGIEREHRPHQHSRDVNAGSKECLQFPSLAGSDQHQTQAGEDDERDQKSDRISEVVFLNRRAHKPRGDQTHQCKDQLYRPHA